MSARRRGARQGRAGLDQLVLTTDAQLSCPSAAQLIVSLSLSLSFRSFLVLPCLSCSQSGSSGSAQRRVASRRVSTRGRLKVAKVVDDDDLGEWAFLGVAFHPWPVFDGPREPAEGPRGPGSKADEESTKKRRNGYKKSKSGRRRGQTSTPGPVHGYIFEGGGRGSGGWASILTTSLTHRLTRRNAAVPSSGPT